MKFTLTIFACLLTTSLAQAEVITIDVTVKAIDSKERIITVATKSKEIKLEVGKKAKILVGGKEAMLDSLKAGQKASVSYESQLEIVTQIETEGGDTPTSEPKSTEAAALKKTGYRVVWSISESGESTLTINRPLEERQPTNASMARHDDGTVEFQHDLTAEAVVERVLAHGSENVEFDNKLNALVMTPKAGKVATFAYSAAARLPVTLEFEFDRSTQKSGSTLVVTLKNPASNVDFVVLNLVVTDKTKNSVQVSGSWVGRRDGQGRPVFEPFLKAKAVDLDNPQELTFKIPLKDGEQRNALTFGVSGEPVALNQLVVRGRLSPTFGVAFDEKNGDVFAKEVFPIGLGSTIGIKPGDSLISINGKRPKTLKEAIDLLGKISFGEESEIVVKRIGKPVKVGFTAE